MPHVLFCSAPQSSVAQLLHELSQLEELRQLLASEQLPGLTEDLARLNDTYIVAVSPGPAACSAVAATVGESVKASRQ